MFGSQHGSAPRAAITRSVLRLLYTAPPAGTGHNKRDARQIRLSQLFATAVEEALSARPAGPFMRPPFQWRVHSAGIGTATVHEHVEVAFRDRVLRAHTPPRADSALPTEIRMTRPCSQVRSLDDLESPTAGVAVLGVSDGLFRFLAGRCPPSHGPTVDDRDPEPGLPVPPHLSGRR